jgi:hypothetical protein
LRLLDAKAVACPGNESGRNLQSTRTNHQGDLADLIAFSHEADTIAFFFNRQATVVRDAQAFGAFFQQELDIFQINSCVAADAGVAHDRSHLESFGWFAILL